MVTRALFERALLRHCDETPEARLTAAVIVQAWSDTQDESVRAPRTDAGKFFVDGRMDGFAHAAGTSPAYVRRIYKDAIRANVQSHVAKQANG